MSRQSYVVLTTEGAERVDGRSVKAVLNLYGTKKVLGVIREDVVVMPPVGPDAPQFRVMVIAKAKSS